MYDYNQIQSDRISNYVLFASLYFPPIEEFFVILSPNFILPNHFFARIYDYTFNVFKFANFEFLSLFEFIDL